MKFHFFGTCAGTEPMPNRRHQSFAIEVNDALYWFDAGAGCSITAHLMKVNLLNVKNIIISHPHLDHVGGLGNLIWDIEKIKKTNKTTTRFASVDLYLPQMEIWEGFALILKYARKQATDELKINAHQVKDGLLFADENMIVTAYHNHHIGLQIDNIWRSFSYVIQIENKKIIYSGDLGALADLDDIINDGCNIILIETGHFLHTDVAMYMKQKNVGKLFFIHNGRNILEDPKKALKEIKQIFGNEAIICEDATTIEI